MKSVTVCALLAFALASCVSPISEPSASLVPSARISGSVSPVAATATWVVYFARDLANPVPVTLDGPPPRASVDLRVRQRMELLASGPRSHDGGAFNVLPGLKAQITSVTVAADLATLDYLVPEDDWGLNGSAVLRAFVEQVIYTATEEPGIIRVLLTQNGGHAAIVGGEGLVIDSPQTRAGLGYLGLMPRQAARVIGMSVTGARPLLIPNGIPDEWRAAVRIDANAFSVTYSDPSSAKTITLSIALADLPLPGGASSQSAPNFHGDSASLYHVAVATDPHSDRRLMWTEDGTWSLSGSRGVPYVLSASELTDMEFWRIANSLHPNEI